MPPFVCVEQTNYWLKIIGNNRSAKKILFQILISVYLTLFLLLIGPAAGQWFIIVVVREVSLSKYFYNFLCNCNRTEWSPIWLVSIQVITKSICLSQVMIAD